MFCRHCGNELGNDEKICPNCNTEVVEVLNNGSSKSNQKSETLIDDIKNYFSDIKQNDGKKKKVIVIAIIILALLFVLPFFDNCQANGCNEKKVEGIDYCSKHMCWSGDCNNQALRGEIFCSYHNSVAESNREKALEISNVYVHSNSVSTIAEGTIKNTSYGTTYSFVKVRGAFKNSSGVTIETGDTYAVGSEGLEPGESTSFSIYVDKNYSISKCDVSVYDYDYD